MKLNQFPFQKSRRGYVMVTGIMSITVMATLSVSLIAVANAARRASIRRNVNSQALNLAMGAVDQAVKKLKKDKKYTGLNSVSFGAGTMQVTVTTPNGNPNRRTITGTGTVVASDIAVTRQVRATLDLGTVPPIFYNAFASKESFTINGNVDTSSFPKANQGHVHSNAGLTLHGSSMTIRGRASATGTLSYSGGPTIVGGMSSGVPPMDFPEIDEELKYQALENGSFIGNKSVNNASTVVKGKITGNLSIGSDGCKLEGVVWVTGDVSVGGAVTGKATVIAEGNLSLDARSSYSNSDTSNLFFITTSDDNTAVDLGGNREFKGIVYAPNGGVKIHGTPTIEGGILAKNITLSGNPDAIKWTDFETDPPPMPRIFALRGWEEI